MLLQSTGVANLLFPKISIIISKILENNINNDLDNIGLFIKILILVLDCTMKIVSYIKYCRNEIIEQTKIEKNLTSIDQFSRQKKGLCEKVKLWKFSMNFLNNWIQ